MCSQTNDPLYFNAVLSTMLLVSPSVTVPHNRRQHGLVVRVGDLNT